MTPKHPIKSKTIQGASAGILAGIAMILEGYLSDDATVAGTGLFAVIAGVWAFYGRFKANQRVGF